MIDKHFIDRLIKSTTVKLICTASSGFDNIDTSYSIKKGIDVLNVPKGNYVSAAEHTVGLILTIAKNIWQANHDMKKKIYDSTRYQNFELMGKTIGIIGVGRVGSHVAKIARGFNMNILGNDIDRSLPAKYKWIKFVALNKLLRDSSIITVHTPLDDSTRDLLGSKELKMLKKDAILINCARGGIVNEKALIRAIEAEKIYYAGVDVFVNEPDINLKFYKLQNVIMTPHLAGKTNESRIRISMQLAESILTYFKKI
jgi:D-3-phosphoglycerate dehydrogenase